MKKRLILSFLFFVGLVSAANIYANSIQAISSGNWSDASTWQGGTVPGIGDIAVIDGYTVTINGLTVDALSGISVGDIVLSNANTGLTTPSVLAINGGVSLTVLNNLKMESTTTSKSLSVQLGNSTTELQVYGDIEMRATAAGQVDISLTGGASLGLKGNFVRPDEFGALSMENDCSLILNGSSTQSIPVLNLLNSGADVFQIANLVINNSSDITLAEPLSITGDLTLTNGKIFSSNTNPVVVEDNATILGSSSNAYVVGPVVKKGRSNGSSFTFPVGDATTYAPITISSISDINSEYSAVYKSDPPPYGSVYGINVLNIDPTQYWELDKVSGTDNLSYTVTWSDAAASGVTSLSNAIVVKLNSNTNVWENLGQASVSGGTGSGVSGSVQSLESDPPPYGVSQISVGTGNPGGPLPVELINFQAKKNEGKVYLYWKTASEINSSHYDIERSIDGVNFEVISTIKIEGNSENLRNYRYIDYSPNAGSNYYRLKIVDIDGSYKYSDLVSVSIGDGTTILISPNPIYEYLNIEVTDEIGEGVILEIYDRAGTQIYRGELQFDDGKAKLNINDLKIHSVGAYFLRLSGSTSTKMFKFMKL